MTALAATLCVLPTLMVLEHVIKGLVLAWHALQAHNAAEAYLRRTYCSLHAERWNPLASSRQDALGDARSHCCNTWGWAVLPPLWNF